MEINSDIRTIVANSEINGIYIRFEATCPTGENPQLVRGSISPSVDFGVGRIGSFSLSSTGRLTFDIQENKLTYDELTSVFDASVLGGKKLLSGELLETTHAV